MLSPPHSKCDVAVPDSKGHFSMTVSATLLTPELMHMLPNTAQSIMLLQFKKEEEELEKQVEASSGQKVTATSSTAAKIDSSAKAGGSASSIGTANDVLDVEGIHLASLVPDTCSCARASLT